MERMTVAVEWKAAGDDGTLEGYASTFGNVDLGQDVVEKGAFTDTIGNIKANGIPLLADHVASTSSVLGTIFDAVQDDKGLLIKARFSSAPSAQDTRTKLIEGHLNRLSIGYVPEKFAFEDREGKTVRLLQKIALMETSVVVFPMNPEATIERVKSLASDLDPQQRQALASAIAHPDSVTTYVPDDGKSATTDLPAQQAGPEDEKATPAGEPAESSWDHWASEAVLAGRDPEAIADPAERSGIATRLELMEQSLEELSAPVHPDIRAGLAASLRQQEEQVHRPRESVPAAARGDLRKSLALLEDDPGQINENKEN